MVFMTQDNTHIGALVEECDCLDIEECMEYCIRPKQPVSEGITGPWRSIDHPSTEYLPTNDRAMSQDIYLG